MSHKRGTEGRPAFESSKAKADVPSTSLSLPCLSACSLSALSTKAAKSDAKPFPIELLPPSVLALILQGNCEELVRFCSTSRVFRDVVCGESDDSQSLWNYALDVRGWTHLQNAMLEYSRYKKQTGVKEAKEVFVSLCRIQPRLPSGWARMYERKQVGMLLAALDHDNVPRKTKERLIDFYDSAVHSLLKLDAAGKLISWPTEGAPAGMHPFWFESTFEEDDLFEALAAGIPNGNEQKTIEDFVFSGKENLDLTVLPDSIERIGDYAFSGCRNLSLVELPKSLTSIGASAFLACHNIQVRRLPENLETIGKQAFQCCEDFQPETLPANVKVLTYGCFASTSVSFKSLPESLTEIHAQAFEGCPRLRLRDLSHVRVLGNGAFSKCTSLETLKLNDGLQTIPEDLFTDCKRLKTVLLPVGLEIINKAAFENCTSIEFDSLPPGLRVLSERCFNGCSRLSLQSLPESLTEIHSSALNGCNMSRLTNASNVQIWGWGALAACNLLTLELNANLKAVTAHLFWGNNRLKTVSLPPALERIERSAFANCESIDFESLPGGVRVLSEGCFAGCKSLSLKSLPDGVTKLPERVFEACRSLELTDIANVRFLGRSVFLSCEWLQTLTLCSDLLSIPNAAFKGCFNLRTVMLPAKLMSIEDRAFHQCFSLTDLELPPLLTHVGREAFAQCLSLHVKKLPETLAWVGYAAFSCGVTVDQKELEDFWDRTSSLPQNRGRTLDEITLRRR